MGTEVFQGPTQFRVSADKVNAFEQVYAGTMLDTCWNLTKDAQGAITGIELLCVPGAACEFSDMEKLVPFVDAGSFVTLESFWGNDVWRWIYDGERLTEETVPLSERSAYG
jgi:hypothetical protein